MPLVITAKIDVTKISKPDLFAGKKGTYLDVAFVENKDGVDQYGNNGFISQGVSAEKRSANERGPIIGNWKYHGAKPKGTDPF